jgi:L-alanine-DL-glutamate epimerase-like enolase superfamily enzyme
LAVIDRIETFTGEKQAIVRVTTDDGAVGWGQTGCHQQDVTALVLHDIVAPLALGRDAADPAGLAGRIWTKGYKFRGTFLARAIAGVETALWDIAGKRAGKPVHALIGPLLRPSIDIYASRRTRATTPDQEIAEIEADLAALGCRAVKLQIGERMGGDGDTLAGRTGTLIPLARKRFGEALRLSADANGGYSAEGALRVGRMMEEHGFYHFEEPLPFDDIDGTKRVADGLDRLRITGGEMDNDLSKFRQMIERRCVDVIQCDIGYCGGLSRALAVADLAHANGMTVMPHAPNMSLLQVFTLHMLAAHPAASETHEWRAGKPEAWQMALYDPMPVAVNGMVAAPAGAGWGVEINPDYLGKAARREARR